MRLLIIGSLRGQIGTAGQIALRRGTKVIQSDDVALGLKQLRNGGVDLVMMDATLDVGNLFASMQAEHISTPVVACGVGANSDAAVAAIRAGAQEYVPLPPDPDMIAAILEAVVERDADIVFRDPVMERVIRLADQVAPTEAGILILGESGSGKELMAQRLHAKSRRARQPFIAVNCAAIPDGLLESELFGHEKGAFTGAVARRIGRFEQANGGSLLLDEISEMDVRLQAKLLRAIQEKEITRVGGNASLKVNVRILATSNRDLQAAVREGVFREDLFFRLNVMPIMLPPLRERPGDIEVLSVHFAKKYAKLNNLPERSITHDTLKHLKRRHWRGNVRELENAIHRAVLLSTGPELDTAALTPPNDDEVATHGNKEDAAPSSTVGRTIADVERDLIIDTLEHTFGNRTHAANILGISIRTLRNKLKAYSDQGLSVPPSGVGTPSEEKRSNG